MKISEFAKHNQVTAKMLRHYDELGLLKPEQVEPETGYRIYSMAQSHKLSWILILKNLEFSLLEIKWLLDGPISSEVLVAHLLKKRMEISKDLNNQIQKKIQIDKLIQYLETEAFEMEKTYNLMEMTIEHVHNLKKNMPNTEMFLEEARALVKRISANEPVALIRIDLCHFKAVNDTDGYEVGDKVILAAFQALETALSPYEGWCSIGRAGGDEFIAIVRADQEGTAAIGSEVIRLMKSIDFKQLGCHKQMGLYFGALVKANTPDFPLRELIDETIESLAKARKLGENGILVEGR